MYSTFTDHADTQIDLTADQIAHALDQIDLILRAGLEMNVRDILIAEFVGDQDDVDTAQEFCADTKDTIRALRTLRARLQYHSVICA